MGTPYIGFGNDTLGLCESVKPGDLITCPKCKADRHPLEAADDGSTLLMFYTCGGKLYLGAVAGKSVVNQPSDVHGEI